MDTSHDANNTITDANATISSNTDLSRKYISSDDLLQVQVNTITNGVDDIEITSNNIRTSGMNEHEFAAVSITAVAVVQESLNCDKDLNSHFYLNTDMNENPINCNKKGAIDHESIVAISSDRPNQILLSNNSAHEINC